MVTTAKQAREATPRFGIELEMFGRPSAAVRFMVENGFAAQAFLDGGSGYYEGSDEDDYCEDCESYSCGCNSSYSEDRTLHMYHCECRWCDYERSEGMFACQEDCSVNAEFVSKILSVEDKLDMDLFGQFDERFNDLTSASHWHSPGAEAGNHIHVGVNRDWAYTGWAHMHFLTFGNRWKSVAGAGVRVRGYNGGPHTSWERAEQYNGPQTMAAQFQSGCSWAQRRHETVEYRLWNSPSESGYVPFHVNMSLALTRWATVMADRYPDITVDDARKVIGRSWKRSFSDLSLFLDRRVPGFETHEAKLMDLCASAP